MFLLVSLYSVLNLIRNIYYFFFNLTIKFVLKYLILFLHYKFFLKGHKMKKIGLLFGNQVDFPFRIIDYINSTQKEILAEPIRIGFVATENSLDYDVIFDRISYSVPLYQSILKKAFLDGKIVVNNPFLRLYDDLFFQYSLLSKLGFDTLKTVIIPTKEHVEGTTSETYRNLEYPLDWSALFDYIGFPLSFKVNKSNSETFNFRIYNPMEFFSAYDGSGTKQMVVQQIIEFKEYYRAFVIGQKQVKLIGFDPTKPLHLRYSQEQPKLAESIQNEIEKIALTICNEMEIPINAIDFGLIDSKIYVIDCFNPYLIIEPTHISIQDYDWLIEKIASFLMDLALGNETYSPTLPISKLITKG